MHRGVLVRVDVMERLPDGGWHVAEVKSSTSPKDYHVGDLATQVWVLQGCGIDVRSAAIRQVDNRFVLQVPGELDGLLHDADMLGRLGGIIAGRDGWFAPHRRCSRGRSRRLRRATIVAARMIVNSPLTAAGESRCHRNGR